jgi:hypothetical protein
MDIAPTPAFMEAVRRQIESSIMFRDGSTLAEVSKFLADEGFIVVANREDRIAALRGDPNPSQPASSINDAASAICPVANIGRIVLALASHTPGDFGDSGFNDPILNIINLELPAHMLVEVFASMSVERAAGLVRQGCPDLSLLYEESWPEERPF